MVSPKAEQPLNHKSEIDVDLVEEDINGVNHFVLRFQSLLLLRVEPHFKFVQKLIRGQILCLTGSQFVQLCLYLLSGLEGIYLDRNGVEKRHHVSGNSSTGGSLYELVYVLKHPSVAGVCS